jgi:signal transduction histidine kinase
MNRLTRTAVAAVFATGLAAGTAAGTAAAQDFGTPEEARAMLETTVAAMQSDRAATLAAINSGADPRFLDRDLYPFCGDAAGMFIAHGANADLVGRSLRDLEGKAGSALGEQMYEQASAGEIVEVGYMWPRPGEEEPTEKVSLATKVGDDVCAVGYYAES